MEQTDQHTPLDQNLDIPTDDDYDEEMTDVANESEGIVHNTMNISHHYN